MLIVSITLAAILRCLESVSPRLKLAITLARSQPRECRRQGQSSPDSVIVLVPLSFSSSRPLTPSFSSPFSRPSPPEQLCNHLHSLATAGLVGETSSQQREKVQRLADREKGKMKQLKQKRADVKMGRKKITTWD